MPKAKETTGGAVPAADAAGSPPRTAETVFGESAPVVRVSFDRVAGQLPSGVFHMPADRIGASLREPGHLLIPLRLVQAQLAEGFVCAGWEVVAEQFPRPLLSMTDEEITRGLPDGQLVLPLDELVPQLPDDLFALSGQFVDAPGIDRVPAPFQPVVAHVGGEGQTGTCASDAPVMAPAQPVTETTASKSEWSFRGELSTEGQPVAATALADIELDPILTGATEGSSLSRSHAERRPGRHGSAEGFMARPRPRWADDAAPSPTRETSAEPVKVPPEPDLTAMTQRIATALAPLRPLKVGMESTEGVTLFTVSSPDNGSALVAARLLLPLLAEGRAPWPLCQLTMRGVNTVLILTPLGSTSRGRVALLSAVPPGGAVASVERLSLRAAASAASDLQDEPPSDPDRAEEWQEPDLLDVDVPTRVHQIAASLDALGPVTASVLRDAETGHDFHLFLPEGSNVRMMAQFAGELDRAVCELAVSGHTFHTATLSCGRRRLIVRLAREAPRRAAIVVAGGQTDRAGLAYRQVEAAALALSAG